MINNIHPHWIKELEKQLPEGVTITKVSSLDDNSSNIIVKKGEASKSLTINKADINNKLITNTGKVTITDKETTGLEVITKFIEDNELYLLPEVDYLTHHLNEPVGNFVTLNITPTCITLKGVYSLEVILEDKEVEVNTEATCPIAYLRTRMFFNTHVFDYLTFNLFNGKKLSTQFRNHITETFKELEGEIIKPTNNTFKDLDYLEAFEDEISKVLVFETKDLGRVTLRYNTDENIE